MDFSNVPFEDEFNKTDNYTSFVQRYFVHRYILNLIEPGDDYRILIHSNRICLVTLAPSHPLFKKSEISSVSFKVSDKVNRLDNSCSGKWKVGAQILEPKSPLMIVKCSDGSEYTVRTGIHGKLLEVNQLLLEDPNLLLKAPLGKGYVAIILPKVDQVEQYRGRLMNEEQYNENCKETVIGIA